MKAYCTSVAAVALLMTTATFAPEAIAGERCEECLTIGVVAPLDSFYLCTDKNAAIEIAILMVELGLMETLNSPRVARYENDLVCGYVKDTATLVKPLSVAYHGEIEHGRIIKVVTAAHIELGSDKWDPEENLYLILDSEVIGSGIEELKGLPV